MNFAIRSLDPQEILTRLRDFGAAEMRGRAPEISIAEAALLLAHLDHREADFPAYRRFLEEMADPADPALPVRSDLHERAIYLGNRLFRDLDFAGDTETYDDMQNANLMRVIDRRKGLPVALGILTMHLARAFGWTIRGLNFPGHFLLRLEEAGEQLVIDPFDRARVLVADDLRDILRRVAGRDVPLEPGFIRSIDDRDILLRLQNNIKSRALEAKDLPRAIEVLNSMVLIAPADARLVEELAMLEVQEGNLRTAIERLERYLEDGGTEHRKQVVGLLKRLKNTLN